MDDTLEQLRLMREGGDQGGPTRHRAERDRWSQPRGEFLGAVTSGLPGADRPLVAFASLAARALHAPGHPLYSRRVVPTVHSEPKLKL